MFVKPSEAFLSSSSPNAFVACIFLLISASICTDERSPETPMPCPVVTGEDESPKGRFPYMCSIRNPEHGDHECGGTLIKPRWLLTAAHCVNPDDTETGSSLRIYCDIYRRDEHNRNKTYSAHAIYVHSNWEFDVEKGFDIALVELNRVADLPVPELDTEVNTHASGTKLTVLGWGYTKARDCTDKLQIGLDLNSLPRNFCNNSKLWADLITESMICAGLGSLGTAKSDSGGPLLQLHKPRGRFENGDPSLDVLTGIASFGDNNNSTGDGSKPGVYTSVGFFRGWIDCVTEEDFPREDCPVESNSNTTSSEISSAVAPPVYQPDIEESFPAIEWNITCFELLGDDFEEKDARKRMSDAIEADDSVTVECILDAGLLDANMTYNPLIRFITSNRTSFLHQAAQYNAVQSAKVLVDHGADVDVRDSRERTPLHIVAQHGSLGVAKVLVRQGAKLNVQSKRGDYPLHFAAYYGRESIVEFLAKKGADVNSKNENEETPLHIAAAKGFVSIVEVLVNNEASKSETTESGETPFDVICQEIDRGTECNDETRAELEELLSID